MPRRLLRDGAVVEDEWRYLAQTEAEPVPALIVTLEQWQARRAGWIARSAAQRATRLGVLLAPSQRVELLAEDLGHLSLIAAEFAGPADGRGYSQGRMLREQFGFRGELRATGYVRRDQLFFLARCGFNSFELPEAEFEHAQAALAVFGAAYQPANDLGLPVKLPGRAAESAAP